MRTHMRMAALVGLATLLLIAGLEGGIRLLAPQTVRTAYLEGGPMALKDPVLGHVNRPGTRARVRAPEYDVEYATDSRGFRTGGAPAAEPAAGAVRVLLLGDSFTFGAANAAQDSWAALLEQRFAAGGRAVEIINAGVPGYDTSQQALYLERLYGSLQPDIVLVSFMTNDLFVNEPIQRAPDGTETARGDARAVIAQGARKRSSLQAVTLLKRQLMKSDSTYVRLYLMTPRAAFYSLPASDLVQRKMAATQALLRRIREFCAARGAALLVVSVPQLFQVFAAAADSPPKGVIPDLPDRELTQFAASEGIAWVSLLDLLVQSYRRGGADLYHRYDGHLNAAGNRVMAEAVHAALLPLLAERETAQKAALGTEARP
ncbi:GDSL-type esterase/lipase family protein [Leisingera sp. SS27]|uniref:GDSL-type esterase/lipase family protein n=1 Tax=Leisingera sp. SS27 TaxID=2979462 RepID=UPI00232BB4B6|nr:GDSL-type esterase/lipase family protein [Leisingera sp. SS27]MDC0660387.1 GDSL-type esterase/lipase family protein [Leisingera sp. SS27]